MSGRTHRTRIGDELSDLAHITSGVVQGSCLGPILLWPPCVADADIIFLPCGFFFFFLLFLSSPNLSRRILDVYHTSTHGVALVRI